MLLDEVDRALEQRGHRIVRDADDCNVYVRSHKAGERVLRGLRKPYDRLYPDCTIRTLPCLICRPVSICKTTSMLKII